MKYVWLGVIILGFILQAVSVFFFYPIEPTLNGLGAGVMLGGGIFLFMEKKNG